MENKNAIIVKNTAFLYIRMFLIMGVALYTSRVILKVLGVEDYGIYQTVGGIVGFLSFLNSALSTGTSRFLTFELGVGDFEQLKRTFSTTLTAHILLVFFIVGIAEIAGMWLLHHKLVIPPDRLSAAIYAFHMSLITAGFTLIQVPYNASIIAHEKMLAFAYISMGEVTIQLLIVYLLEIGEADKLKLYASLLALVQIGLFFIYRFYTTRHFKETVYSCQWDKKILRSILSFSGWSLFANGSMALNSQGVLLLLNMFFNPTVVAARSISIQVNMAVTQFVTNFRTAVTPQIVKGYATEDYESSRRLLLASTKYSYYLMFVLCFPIVLVTQPILKLWLGEVPAYTVPFVQIIIIQSLFQVFDTSFYTALYAKGQLRENALISPLLLFLQFPVIYLLFKAGYSPLVLSWTNLGTFAVLGLIVKPILIMKIANYRWHEISEVFRSCMLVTVIALPLPLYLRYLWSVDSIKENLLLVLITVSISALSIYGLGLDKTTKIKVQEYLRILVNKFN